MTRISGVGVGVLRKYTVLTEINLIFISRVSIRSDRILRRKIKIVFGCSFISFQGR